MSDIAFNYLPLDGKLRLAKRGDIVETDLGVKLPYHSEVNDQLIWVQVSLAEKVEIAKVSVRDIVRP